MRRLLGFGIGALLLLTWSGASADKKLDVCSLLTADEIASATAQKVGPSRVMEIPISTGPYKGETMTACMWKLGETGMFSVNVIRMHVSAAEREQAVAKLREGLNRAKAKGWTEEKQDFGDVKCVYMSPPPSGKNLPTMTGCMGMAKGMGMSVGTMTGEGVTKVALAKIKALFDKAGGRL